MNDIPADTLYGPNELCAWLDSQPPLSDDDIRAMSAYFKSDYFQYAENNLCDIINIEKQKKEVTL